MCKCAWVLLVLDKTCIINPVGNATKLVSLLFKEDKLCAHRLIKLISLLFSLSLREHWHDSWLESQHLVDFQVHEIISVWWKKWNNLSAICKISFIGLEAIHHSLVGVFWPMSQHPSNGDRSERRSSNRQERERTRKKPWQKWPQATVSLALPITMSCVFRTHSDQSFVLIAN